MARRAGRNGAVYMSTTGSGNAINLTLATWDVNFSTQKIDVTSFRDANMVKVQGLPDAQGNFSGFWETSETTLYTASRSTDGVKIYLYPDIVNNATAYVYGPAWVDFNMSVDVNGAVTISGSWVANGNVGVMNI
jgi:hypothetical protein